MLVVEFDVYRNRQGINSMLLMIDNYDSFTYNIVQYFGELGQDVQVYRNDAITIADIARLRPDYLVISPGPVFRWRRSVSFPAKFLCSASASVIRLSVKPSVARSFTPNN
jgi:hypothetical protein